MYHNAHLHKFTTDSGLLIFVPSAQGRRQGEEIIKLVLKRWTPPRYFFHFQRGGHVAASLLQLSSSTFARLDIKSFFDSVTRTKVHRALRRIGVPHRDAFEIATCSTVRKLGSKSFSLPFGYVQSPLLASLTLESSALGAALRSAAAQLRLSVYVDDILMSSENEEELAQKIAELDSAARLSGFELHPHKRQLGATVEAFNLHLTNGVARFTDERMAEWMRSERSSNNLRELAIVRYVRGINPMQADILEKAYGLV